MELPRAGATPGREGALDQELYARWIEMYSGEEFAKLAGWCRAVCDEVAADAGGQVRCRILEAFLASSRYELEFWGAAWASAR